MHLLLLLVVGVCILVLHSWRRLLREGMHVLVGRFRLCL